MTGKLNILMTGLHCGAQPNPLLSTASFTTNSHHENLSDSVQNFLRYAAIGTQAMFE